MVARPASNCGASPGKRLLYPAVGGAVLVALIVGAFLLNRAATGVLEGPKFRAMLEKETGKGLHLDTALYGPITRVGVLGMSDDWGAGQKGQKTIVALKAEQVTASFNPLGIFLKRWQVEFLHFHTGTVWLQKTEPKPNEPKPPGPPWYLFFWPDRVYLKDIKVDDANVFFQLQDQESGLHDTFLEITRTAATTNTTRGAGLLPRPIRPGSTSSISICWCGNRVSIAPRLSWVTILRIPSSR